MKKGILLRALLAYGCADVSDERSGSKNTINTEKELELNMTEDQLAYTSEDLSALRTERNALREQKYNRKLLYRSRLFC